MSNLEKLEAGKRHGSNLCNMFSQTSELTEAQIRTSYEISKEVFLKKLNAQLDTTDNQTEVNAIRQAITSISGAQFKINVVVVKGPNGESNFIGHTYFWTDKPMLFNALVGNNFDGSPRIFQVPDPKWVRKEDMPLNPDDDEDFIQEIIEADTKGMDPNSLEYRTLVDQIKEYYTAPLIYKSIPLMTLFQVEYTPSQLETIWEKLTNFSTPDKRLYAKTPEELSDLKDQMLKDPRLKHKANDPQKWIDDTLKITEDYRMSYLGETYYTKLPTEWDPEWDDEEGPTVYIPTGFEIKDLPKSCGFLFNPAHVTDHADGSIISEIVSPKPVPHFVKVGDILNHLGMYSTDIRTYKNLDTGASYTFPIVKLTPDLKNKDEWGKQSQKLHIKFSNSGDSEWDALFALRMIKQLTIDAPYPSLDGGKRNFTIPLFTFNPKFSNPGKVWNNSQPNAGKGWSNSQSNGGGKYPPRVGHSEREFQSPSRRPPQKVETKITPSEPSNVPVNQSGRTPLPPNQWGRDFVKRPPPQKPVQGLRDSAPVLKQENLASAQSEPFSPPINQSRWEGNSNKPSFAQSMKPGSPSRQPPIVVSSARSVCPYCKSEDFSTTFHKNKQGKSEKVITCTQCGEMI